jgi:hypothetical protein
VSWRLIFRETAELLKRPKSEKPVQLVKAVPEAIFISRNKIIS